MATPIRLFVVCTIQALIIWIAYPLVFGFVYGSFKKEITRLELTLDRIRTQEGLQPHMRLGKTDTLVPGGCVCPVKGQGSFEGRSTDINNLQANDDVTDNILRCCTHNEDTLRQIIQKVIHEGRLHYKSRKTGIALGTVERIVKNLINKNRTESFSAAASSSSLSHRPALPSAVHLTGSPDGFTKNKSIRSERGKVKVGPWESMYGQAFTELVDVDAHHMVAPQTGLYYIYSQAYFRDERDDEERRLQQLNEYLHYTVLGSTYYAADPINLMKSGRTNERKDGTDFYYSSYHAGLFKLREGDYIYMKVFLPGKSVKLDCHQESTYMGMYLVSTDIE